MYEHVRPKVKTNKQTAQRNPTQPRLRPGRRRRRRWWCFVSSVRVRDKQIIPSPSPSPSNPSYDPFTHFHVALFREERISPLTIIMSMMSNLCLNEWDVGCLFVYGLERVNDAENFLHWVQVGDYWSWAVLYGGLYVRYRKERMQRARGCDYCVEILGE